jgi:hypothetical protein
MNDGCARRYPWWPWCSAACWSCLWPCLVIVEVVMLGCLAAARRAGDRPPKQQRERLLPLRLCSLLLRRGRMRWSCECVSVVKEWTAHTV